MRNRDITKSIFPLAPFFLKLHFTPLFPTLPPPPCTLSGVEGWVCGQFITPRLCHSFLPMCFSCSTMGFYPTGQSIKLLQHRSSPQGRVLKQQTVPAWVPRGLQLLPEKQVLHRLLSMGSSFCQDPAPVWILHGLQDGYLLHHGPEQAQGGQPASPWSSP